MKQGFFRACIELHNHKLFSSLLQRFAKSRLSRPLIPSFCKTFRLEMAEAKDSVDSFQSLHELFTRELREDVRSISASPRNLISPVDGRCAEVGTLSNDVQFEVKGQRYSFAEMLGSEEMAKTYAKGTYFILYLSPRDYHRIHSPLHATCTDEWMLGGRSYPVNEWGLRYGRKPLSRNKRLVSVLKGAKGERLALISIGAVNINSIVKTKHESVWRKGEEVAYFSFGSTVILVLEAGIAAPVIEPGTNVKMGQTIATLVSQTTS
ncbi:phosphatidylserine decarboxylase [Shouchella shacheensis]|uniref:phosphatidylserine decarboxylase n=1 Tax=Shouchella shacheensis TaxID=1649580 RepID=UPI0015D5F581|nr:phosphatidylserine decarboxylase [Shouchella shacheensis]